MTGLKGKGKGPVYTISSSTICTSLNDDGCCSTVPCGSNLTGSEDVPLPKPGKVVIDMNSIEPISVTTVNCNKEKSNKNNHVRFSLEDSYSDNVYLKPYCKYSEPAYYRKSSFKENLKTLCQTFVEFMKKAGKWCCLILVILGLILFFCLKVDFHR